jgi:dnd system-associated protein 4
MRGIKYARTHDALVRRLGETLHPVNNRSIFPTMRELIAFAAVLGFETETFRPLKSDAQEIDWRIWQNNEQALDLLYLIPLAHKRNVEILREDAEEELQTIFEGYANGGLEVLDGWMKEKPDDLNGDRAILAALGKYGFLATPKDAEDVLADIEF